MNAGDKPIANPYVVLREEFDDWAILFNPDTCNGFGLSPTGVYLWKLLDGKHAIDGLLDEIRHLDDGVPEEARSEIGAFIDALVAEGLAGFDNALTSLPHKRDGVALPPEKGFSMGGSFNYEPPKLIDFTAQPATGTCCNPIGTSPGGACDSCGACATLNCQSCGTSANQVCNDGTTAGSRCCTGSSPGPASCCNPNGNCPSASSGCYLGCQTPCITGNAAV